jgi:hypothetical protein
MDDPGDGNGVLRSSNGSDRIKLGGRREITRHYYSLIT